MITVGKKESEGIGVELLKAGTAALGIHLSLAQIERFRAYYQEIASWNTRVNLTSVTRWEDVQTIHFVDSLTVTLAIPRALLESGRIVDVGSGAGFPGIPLKIAFPSARVTLIESTGKKAAFLTHLTHTLGLEDVDVRTGRAEALAHDPELRESFDCVVSRAVAVMAALAELTLPFCRVGGVVVAQKKLDTRDEVRQAQRAIETMGGGLKDVTEVSPEILGGARSLVVLEKLNPTPDRYPRRPGMPAKRPL